MPGRKKVPPKWRNFSNPVIILLIYVLSMTTVSGCGMSVHNEVTTRAAYTFNPVIKEYSKYADYIRQNPQFVQAGSFFPDWGYGCQSNDEASEDAHWPPFFKAAAEYIRDKFHSGEWNSDDKHAQSVISFLYAIVSHGTADVSWHSIGMHTGFITVMSEVNFNQDWGTAHSTADTGGEFTLSHMVNLDHLENKWQVPVDDVIEIYRRTNRTVHQKHIDYCVKRAFAAIQANKRFGKIFFGAYGEKSPFLIEKLEEYHRGGLNSMSAETHECWDGLSNWLENGPSIDSTEICCTFNSSYGNGPPKVRPPVITDLDRFFNTYATELLASNGFAINSHVDMRGVTHYEIHRHLIDETSTVEEWLSKESTPDDVRFDQIFQDVISDSSQSSPRKRSSPSTQDSAGPGLGLAPKCREVPKNEDLVVSLELPYDYASFGHDMVSGDFDGDGIPDLAISAPFYSENPSIPQTGAVFLFYGGGKKSKFRSHLPLNTTNILHLADKVIFEPESVKQSRFGWSLAVVDLNADGIDDLAISAPSYGAPLYPYTGKVYVYFGRATSTAPLFSAKKELRKLFANVMLFGNPLFGTIVSKDDLKEEEFGLPNHPDLRIRSDEMAGNNWQTDSFGQVLASGDVDGDGYRDLFVGCQYCGYYNELRTPRLLQSGGVFAFHSGSLHRGNITFFDADWSLGSPNDQNYEWFGAAVEVHVGKSREPTVLVGAPGYKDQNSQLVGRVYGFEVVRSEKMGDSGKNGKWNLKKKFDLSGTEEFQGFGSKIIAGDFLVNGNGYFIVASQSELRVQKFPRYQKYWQAGAIRIVDMSYLGNGTLLSDDVMAVGRGVLSVLKGTEKAAHLGTEIYWDDDERELWTSEPFSLWESGQAFRYPLDSLLFSNKENSKSSQSPNYNGDYFNVSLDLAEECIVGREKQSKFGNKILKFDFNGDGRRDMIIASEHSSSVARLGGSITIILG